MEDRWTAMIVAIQRQAIILGPWSLRWQRGRALRESSSRTAVTQNLHDSFIGQSRKLISPSEGREG